jgi:hypothetical protein
MMPIVVTTEDASLVSVSSRLVYCDPWIAPAKINIQTVVIGTVNYNVQYTLDDPNSPTDPVAVGSITWVDSGQGAKTANNAFQLDFAPSYIRVLQNTGSGSTTTTILQSGSVTL